jgi:hypothetical protein
MRYQGRNPAIPDFVEVLPLSVLTPDNPLDTVRFKQLIGRLPTDQTLFQCAKLNLIFTYASLTQKQGVQEFAIELLRTQGWLYQRDIERIEKYLRKRNERFEDNVFFSRTQCLEPMRWLSVWGDGSGRLRTNDIQQKQAFARAMLQSFEIWKERTQRQLPLMILSDNITREQRFESLRFMREAEQWKLPNLHPAFHFCRTKRLFIDEFFGHNSELQSAVERQLQMSIDDYVACIINVSSLVGRWLAKMDNRILSTFEFDPTTVCSTAPHMAPTFDRFVQLEGQTAEQLLRRYENSISDPFSLTETRPLRERPILLRNDRRSATVIDLSFFFERASSGLLFQSASVAGNAAMEQFGEAFERYVCGRLDDYVLTKRSQGMILTGFPRVSTDVMEAEFADYALVIGKTVLLIEIKGSWFREDNVAKQTADDYWLEVQKKFVTNDKGRRKGVGQLAHSIKTWTEGSAKPSLPIQLQDIDTIIPVLLTSDRYMSALWHSEFLAEEFQSRLLGFASPVKADFDLKGYRILNLCLITIDEFDEFEARAVRGTLDELLKAYSEQIPDRESCAGAFICMQEPDPFALKPALAAEGEHVIDAAAERFFGTDEC